MGTDLEVKLALAAGLPLGQRLEPLAEIGRSVIEDASRGAANGVDQKLVSEILTVIEDDVGTGRARLELGEILGALGDPRVRSPNDPSYWVEVPADGGAVVIGRYPVTNHEFRSWVGEGGYRDRKAWSDAGWRWLDKCADPWPVRAEAEQSRPFVVPNQPVVGVTWFEAEAFARAHASRLPWEAERVWVVRGREKRPYPWGAPFGTGNANTREEVLGKPCAVGLYRRDRTPEGVCDLAGNVAEWTNDEVGVHGEERLIHPGAWDQPSMAAWAKAKTSEPPDARWAGLGFRLARDA